MELIWKHTFFNQLRVQPTEARHGKADAAAGVAFGTLFVCVRHIHTFEYT